MDRVVTFFKKIFASFFLFLIIAPNIVLAAGAINSKINIKKTSVDMKVCDCDKDSDDPNCDIKCSENEKNPLSNVQLTTEVLKPFPNSQMQAFPNGKDCATVILEAINSKDGTFAQNLPLVIEKPDAVTINGPQTTDTGSVKWCATSTKPMKAKVIVKLKDFPQEKSTFQVNFLPSTKIQDLTDRNSFFFDLPITFSAQIDPVMIHGLKESKLSFNVNKNSSQADGVHDVRESVEINLNCSSSGICTATIPSSNTAADINQNGTFNYSFVFVDQNGSRFSKSFKGTLTIP
ncbi:MAG: hypothetical protein WC536_00880 [Patescibacteria group bacterium]